MKKTGFLSASRKSGGCSPAMISPMRLAPAGGAIAGSGREEDFVVVPAGHGRFKQAGIESDRLARGLRQRNQRQIDHGARPRTPAHSFVRSPARPSETSMAALAWTRSARGEVETRMRQQITADEMVARGAGARARRARDRAGAPGPARRRRSCRRRRSRRPALRPLRGTKRDARPSAVIEIVSGPGVAAVSPPMSGAAVRVRVLSEPRGEGGEPVIGPVARARPEQQKADRLRALGGEVGEIDAQRLLRDQRRRIVREEMHARDEHVGRDDESARCDGSQQRRVVGQGRAPPARRWARKTRAMSSSSV